MQILTEQELHNLAMNIVGKKLQKMGYEFQAINSQLKRHPTTTTTSFPKASQIVVRE